MTTAMRREADMVQATYLNKEFSAGFRVEVAALLWERDPERGADGQFHPLVKVSLRARRTVDVSKIAVALGGGGHRGAAGANIDGTLDEAGKLVVAEAQKHV